MKENKLFHSHRPWFQVKATLEWIILICINKVLIIIIPQTVNVHRSTSNNGRMIRRHICQNYKHGRMIKLIT